MAGFGLMLASTACSHEEIEDYSGCKAGVYIQEVIGSDAYGNPTVFRQGDESFSFTKSSPTATQGKVAFTVRLMGEVTDYDRPYKLTVVSEKTDAREGVDYDISSNKFTIKAGANSDLVIVTLLRNPELVQRTVTVFFKLEPNEHFELPMEEYKTSSSWSVDAPMASATTYYVKFGEVYIKPSQWDNGSQHYGAYSVNKFLLLNRLMDWTVTDWDNAGAPGAKIGLGRFEFAATVLRRYLQEQADAGTPVIDDDGSYMQLGTNHLVDYSAYNQ